MRWKETLRYVHHPGGLLFDQDFDGYMVKLDVEEARRKRYQRRQFALIDSPGHR
ncbi:MAG: hypothetical protein OXB98_18260 [Bryobacterales bacterium]|nr:hypothetical protein [Bryobacterales bacterium]